MLKQLATRCHLRLKHGQNLRIILQLGINYILLASLKIHKCLHGINHPIVHYYAVCWNEERILPFMLDHYGHFVDHFTIFDNHSTDKTAYIVSTYHNVQLISFGNPNIFDDGENRRIKNTCWKQSRGKADWVIVCDMDEFLYQPDIENCLQELSQKKVSLPKTEGYEMYSELFPTYTTGIMLTDTVQNGVRSTWLDKRILFDPHRIVDINYSVGAHQAEPTGIVRQSSDGPFKVLHYKHMGLDYLLERYRKLGERLSDYNRTNKFGTHYLAKQEELRAEMERGLKEAKNVVNDR